MTNILVFGASITWGAWDKEGGWVSRLRKFIDEKNISDSDYNCMIYNLGISGDNTNYLLERLKNEVKARLSEEETIIIFSIGTNDSAASKSEVSVSIDKFKENLKKIINIAKKHTDKIIILGLTKVDESKTNPIPWNPSVRYINENIKRYNLELKRLAEKENLNYINLFDLLGKEDLEDGVHPNSEGHEKIFQIIKDFLIGKEIIE